MSSARLAGKIPQDEQQFHGEPDQADSYNGESFSNPESSNISFTMSSPPPYAASQVNDSVDLIGKVTDHNLMSSFSPSIFSPAEKMPRLPKKRNIEGGLMDSAEKSSPESRSASRNSIDLPTALSLLDSPHYNLWSAGASNRFPSMLGSNGRLFASSGIAMDSNYSQESNQTTSVDESIQQEFAIPTSIKNKMKTMIGSPTESATLGNGTNWSKSHLYTEPKVEETDERVQQKSIKVSPVSVAKSPAIDATSCNCKKSKCLKLYCDCFAVLNYCGLNCNCYDCCNKTEREATRQEAIRSTKERNSMAFTTKINEKEQHSTGCHCKNSQCLKKYCECFTGGAYCGNNCKCLTCLNFSGSVELVKARNNCKDFNETTMISKKKKDSPSAPHPARTLSTTTPVDSAKGGSIAVTPVDGTGTKLLTPDLIMRSATHPNVLTSRMVGGMGNLGPTGRIVLNSIPHAPITPEASGNTKRSKFGGAGDSSLTDSASSFESHSSLKQLRNRKVADASVDSKNLVGTNVPMKKRQVKFAPIVYPFFGDDLPSTSKIIALKCLDYLEGKDIYAMSQVNKIWSQAAMDDALWE